MTVALPFHDTGPPVPAIRVTPNYDHMHEFCRGEKPELVRRSSENAGPPDHTGTPETVGEAGL